MTRRDYVLIARVLRATDATYAQASAFADELERDNPRFDRSRFLHAALGIEAVRHD